MDAHGYPRFSLGTIWWVGHFRAQYKREHPSRFLPPCSPRGSIYPATLPRSMAAARAFHSIPNWPNRACSSAAWDALIREHGERLRPYLYAAVDGRADKFAALHAAYWSGGMVLYVPKGVVIERPLHMLSALSPGATDFSHALIILDEGAEATVLAETASVDSEAAGLHCGAIEIHVGCRAKLRYVNLQNWGTGVWHFAHQHALVHQDASLQWTIGALGSHLAKVNQHVALVGPGANTEVNGVMFAEGKQHLSYHTLQHHKAPHCKSDLLYKGALQDTSRLVWRGMIKVDRDAQKNRRLPARRQPDPFRRCPGRLDPGAGDRGRRRQMLPRCHGRPRGRRASILRLLPWPDPQGSHPHDRRGLLPTGI